MELLFMMLHFGACQPLVTIHLHCLVDYNFFCSLESHTSLEKHEGA